MSTPQNPLDDSSRKHGIRAGESESKRVRRPPTDQPESEADTIAMDSAPSHTLHTALSHVRADDTSATQPFITCLKFEQRDTCLDLQQWFNKKPTLKRMNATHKFAQLLNNIEWTEIKGPLMVAICSFHLHIAPYSPAGGQGYDRNAKGSVDFGYFRSNVHRLKDIYERAVQILSESAAVGKIQPPMNEPLIRNLVVLEPPSGDLKHLTQVNLGNIVVHRYTGRNTHAPFASLATTHNNLTLLERIDAMIEAHRNKLLQDRKLVELLHGFKGQYKLENERYAGKGRVLAQLTTYSMDELVALSAPPTEGNFHDFMLQDRGACADHLSSLINSQKKANVRAIGAEGHPSVILNWEGFSRANKNVLAKMNLFLEQFNKTRSDWQIVATHRGSFGFQRPTVAEVADSVRLWLGYAPVESLIAALNSALGTELGGTATSPVPAALVHVEALKVAVRHAMIAQEGNVNSLPSGRRPFYGWLRHRMLINCDKARCLLRMAVRMKDRSTLTPETLTQHYIKCSEVTERLLEYGFLFTALWMKETGSAPSDTPDPFENHFGRLFEKCDFRVYYLDSGMQAINCAELVARQFVQQDKPGQKDLETYFEWENVRAKLKIATSRSGFSIVSADLSPVITSPHPGMERLSRHAHMADVKGAIRTSKLAILDITNVTLACARQVLDQLPSQSGKPLLLVESLTKHIQIGADKFLAGRLVVVGHNKEFLQRVDEVIGDISRAAHNKLLQAFRINLERAVYGPPQ